MRYKTFGKTGLKVSELALGTWGIGGAGWDDNSDDTRLDAIRAAGHPTATAIIVTNGDDMGELKMLAEGDVLAGTPLFKF